MFERISLFAKILVCLDGSSLAEQVLPYVTEQALHFGSKVVLLQVVTPSGAVPAVAQAGHSADVILDQIKKQEIAAKAYLDRMAAPLRLGGLDVDCVTLAGVPGEAGKDIVRYAGENEVDLVAIATRGQSGLKRFVFGSVADYVLRESGLPVLVISPQETET